MDGSRLPLDTQVAVLTAEVTALRRDLGEIQETLERWLENSARDRLTLLVALGTGWLGLIAAAITALMRH